MATQLKSELIEDNNRLRECNKKLETDIKALKRLYGELENKYINVSKEHERMTEGLKKAFAPILAELLQENLHIETTDKDGWTDITLKYDGLELSTDSIHTENY